MKLLPWGASPLSCGLQAGSWEFMKYDMLGTENRERLNYKIRYVRDILRADTKVMTQLHDLCSSQVCVLYSFKICLQALIEAVSEAVLGVLRASGMRLGGSQRLFGRLGGPQ